MEQLLKKYYDYFLENENAQDIFYKIYYIITNKYNLSKNNQLTIDITEFFKFFDEITPFGFNKRGIYSSSYGYEIVAINNFKKLSKASFDWFENSKYITRNATFLFSKSNTEQNWCNLYLSIKPEKYIETSIKIQKFIEQLITNHPNEKISECKFQNTPSNEAIIMKFSCEEHYKEFLIFLEENKEIQETFDEANSFLPKNEQGIAITSDNNDYYNYFVAQILVDYIKYCKEKNKTVNIPELVNYIKCYNTQDDKILKNLDTELISDYKYILISKLNGIEDSIIIATILNKKTKKLALKVA